MGHYNTELARQFDNRMMQAEVLRPLRQRAVVRGGSRSFRAGARSPRSTTSSPPRSTGSPAPKRSRTDFKVLPRKRRQPRRRAQGRHAQVPLRHQRLGVPPLPGVRGGRQGRHRLARGPVAGDGGEGPVYSRFESRRNMLWDTASTEMDLSDARYVFRSKWVDLDIAISWFPDRRCAARGLRLDQSRHRRRGRPGLRRRADGLGRRRDHQRRHRGRQQLSSAYHRRRVRLIEARYKIPKPGAEADQGSQFHGERYDPTSRGRYEGAARRDRRRRCRAHRHGDALRDRDAGTHDLRVGQPYRHGRFPFTPIWCYRRSSNGLPYGVIRRVLDLQDDVSMRARRRRGTSPRPARPS